MHDKIEVRVRMMESTTTSHLVLKCKRKINKILLNYTG